MQGIGSLSLIEESAAIFIGSPLDPTDSIHTLSDHVTINGSAALGIFPNLASFASGLSLARSCLSEACPSPQLLLSQLCSVFSTKEASTLDSRVSFSFLYFLFFPQCPVLGMLYGISCIDIELNPTCNFYYLL